MAITRDSRHKRRHTGGRRNVHKKKRKFETGRQAAMTKLVGAGEKRIRQVRARGGNIKYRALRLDSGNFSWGQEVCTKKTRILDVVYNASNNELVRTKTLVKGCIVQIDATPFKTWYETHYKVALGAKKEAHVLTPADVKGSSHVVRKAANLSKAAAIEPAVAEQFQTGRVLACISSRPGQSGRADGYILEGPELAFYQKQLLKKKSGKKA
eukprot:CAMPEP_0197448880 /NCGR_PEP_ID=MMETSP1175-20131217/19360_1 /TAXON_ID=1003142 /ORGANISM="Triceratium dubium, Strain CCMP147" /LENGTH=210 /DNA_ID=CAMNT_0042980795 /DNA_START=18 /DNA_END=650 /DNA_ORIENTATION=+